MGASCLPMTMGLDRFGRCYGTAQLCVAIADGRARAEQDRHPDTAGSGQAAGRGLAQPDGRLQHIIPAGVAAPRLANPIRPRNRRPQNHHANLAQCAGGPAEADRHRRLPGLDITDLPPGLSRRQWQLCPEPGRGLAGANGYRRRLQSDCRRHVHAANVGNGAKLHADGKPRFSPGQHTFDSADLQPRLRCAAEHTVDLQRHWGTAGVSRLQPQTGAFTPNGTPASTAYQSNNSITAENTILGSVRSASADFTIAVSPPSTPPNPPPSGAATEAQRT
jgi:hypothetical protein